MTRRQGKLHLNAFLLSVGHHEASWRLPESDAFASTNVNHGMLITEFVCQRNGMSDVYVAKGGMFVHAR